MRKPHKISVSLLIFILLIAMVFSLAQAAVGFTAHPVLPENQREDTRAFFDLIVKPGQTQELSILVTNEDNVDITLIPEKLIATTNRNGDVVYVEPDNIDFTPRHLITDIISISETGVVVPAGQQRNINFTITIPDEEFDGILLGAVRLLRALTEDEAATAGVINQYAINIPIRLRQNEDEVDKGFYLQNVEADLVHFAASVVVNITNPQPRLFRNMTVSVDIFPENSIIALMRFHSENIGMAPESIMPLTVFDMELEYLEPGFYIAVVRIEHDGDEFNFEERFEVTAEEAHLINEMLVPTDEHEAEEAVEAEDYGFPLWIIILIAVVIVLLLVLIIILIKHMRKYKKMAENKKP